MTSDNFGNGLDDWGTVIADMHVGLKLKQVMIIKGLTKAKAKCPRCENETLQGRLAGRRNHLRCWCDTPGCAFHQMME